MSKSAEKAVEVGTKCQVTVNGNLKEGVVRYVGKIKSKEGVWAGVELKTPGLHFPSYFLLFFGFIYKFNAQTEKTTEPLLKSNTFLANHFTAYSLHSVT